MFFVLYNWSTIIWNWIFPGLLLLLRPQIFPDEIKVPWCYLQQEFRLESQPEIFKIRFIILDGVRHQVLVCLFVCLVSSTTRLYRGRAPRQERLTILRAATHETELGDHDFCLSRSHYTDTDPTCRERAATAGIEPGTSSPGVARSTAELPRPPRHQVQVLPSLRYHRIEYGYIAANANTGETSSWYRNTVCYDEKKNIEKFGCDTRRNSCRNSFWCVLCFSRIHDPVC